MSIVYVDVSRRQRALLSDQAHDQIRQDILECVLKPGTEVTETELARRYRLGKAPIRAALARLGQQGFVRALPRRGYMVVPVTVRDVHELFEFRLLLEPVTVRMAAGRLTPETRRRLEQLCDQDVAAGLAFNRCNSEFHVTIATIGGNRRMAETLAQLLAQMERLFLLRYPPIDNRLGLEEHQRILDALSRGDGEAAAVIATNHIEAARRKVLESVLSSTEVMSVPIAPEAGPKVTRSPVRRSRVRPRRRAMAPRR
jgi:DNA-binding GntR family transcriptional regulator